MKASCHLLVKEREYSLMGRVLKGSTHAFIRDDLLRGVLTRDHAFDILLILSKPYSEGT